MRHKRYSRRKMRKKEEDPMTGTGNLVDAMLVIAVGLLIFLVLSWNMQNVMFSDMSSEEKTQAMQSMKNAVDVDMGQELNDTPDTSQSSGQGYQEMGTVYKDPTTGKLIMVEG